MRQEDTQIGCHGKDGVDELAPAARHLYVESSQVSAKTSATTASPVHTEPGAGCNRLRLGLGKNC
jgi:hypothetical protein